MDISQDVKCLKGVGPKLLEKLNKCGIFSVLDLLLYFPRDYEFLRSNIPFNEIDEEDKQVFNEESNGKSKTEMKESLVDILDISIENIEID